MSRTIEPGISLLTACEIRVVVLPIGPMPKDTFEGYLDVFNAHRHVPLNATRSFYQGGPKSPFAHLPYKTGAMHFRLIQADEARRRSRITDLHQQRQVVAVLGLLHCPLVEDIMAAHSEFGRASRQWPEALVSRCCAFEPSSTHLTTPGCQKLTDLMIFPGGHLHQHLEVYMHEFAAAVLAAIEEYVLNASVSNIKLNTYIDSGDFLGPMAQIEEGLRKLNLNEEEIKEKKRWGRFQKSKGDWALMAGSPRDAFEHYKSAMELSRIAGDAICCGAAVEGLAHARVLEALVLARPAAAAAAAARHPATTAAASSSSSATSQIQQLARSEAPTADTPVAAAAAAGERSSTAGAAPSSTTAGSSSSSSEAGIFTLTSTELDLAHSGVAAAIAAAVPAAAAAAAMDPGHPAAGDGFVAGAAAAAAGGVAAGKDPAVEGAGSAEPISSTNIQIQLPGDTAPPIPAAAAAAAATTPKAAAAAAAALSPATPSGSSKPPPPSTPTRPSTISAAAAAAGSSQALPGCDYCLSGPGAWAVLAAADLEGEIRELLAEARSWYKKKGGALALQIEQVLKLCRFVAGLHGTIPAKKEAAEAVGLILDSLPSLSLPEDRLIALVEAGQVLGLAGCGRKRLLLLWSALEMFRASATVEKGAPPADAAAMMRLALRSLAPPEQSRQQDPDDLPRVHWSMLRFIAWQQQFISQQQLAAAHSASNSKTTPAAGGSIHRRRGSIGTAAATAAGSSKQQQQFQQLLGPQLQLLRSDQAAVYLQRLGGCDPRDSGSNPSDSSSASQGFSVGDAGGASDWLCLWDSVLVAVLEAVLNIAKVANAPLEAWEAAATLLRECYTLLPQTLQVSLMETCSVAGSAMGSRSRHRPGPGPGPQVQLKRVMQGSPSLQLVHLSAAEQGLSAGTAAAKRSEAAAAASQGPFIFNPYAAKRKGARAAAAAEAALPEWVCGTEGLVEVLLVNPCATSLKLDQLQLVVQPLLPKPQQQQQQQKDADSGNAADSSKSLSPAAAAAAAAAAGSSQVAAVRSVSVSLAAGSKPVRVVLGYTPSRPGLAAITGVQASCWGVNWYQPFVHLPKLTTPAGAGHEGVTPQGCFTVAVQPQLPLIKAVLHGPEVQLVQPSDDELAGLAAAAATSGSSSSSTAASPAWSAAAGGGGGGSSGSAAAAAADLDKKVTTVFAFEGQTLHWTLNLTNISKEAVTGCKVTVLNAKGSVIKPLFNITNTVAAAAATPQQQQQQQQLPASFSGAHMEVSESGLTVALPLLPGSSVSLPVSVVVGKPPGDAFDAVMLQVRITYFGSATSVTQNNSSSSSSSSDGQVLGRRLTLPLKVSIQPTIQVTSVRFLQQTIPLVDHQPINLNPPRSPTKHTTRQHTALHREPSTPAAAAAAAAGFSTPNPQTPAAAAAAAGLSSSPTPFNTPNTALIRRQQSRHVRNSSEGAVPVLSAGMGVNNMLGFAPDSGLANTPTRKTLNPDISRGLGGMQVGSELLSAAAAAGAEDAAASSQQQQQQQNPVAIQGSIGGSSSSSGGLLSVGSAPVLELSVRNASERYFRAWLGCVPNHLTAESPLSSVVVLEPGDTQKLTALLPAAAAAAGSAQGNPSSSSSSSSLYEPSRLQCAERLVDQLVVCWEMITGAAAAAGQLPRGRVQLAPVDVAANLTQGAVASLWPSPLSLRVCAAPAAVGPAGTAAIHSSGQLVDLLGVMRQSGMSTPVIPGLSGPLWGLHMSVGQWLALDLEAAYAAASSSSSSEGGPDSDTSLLLQVTLYVTDMLTSSSSSSTGQPGTPPAAAAAAALAGPSSWNLAGRSSSTGQGFAASPAAAGFSCSVSQGLIDPGVFVAGCYSGIQLQIQPGGKAVQKLRALLVQPGLYQFGVADAGVVGGSESGVPSGSSAAAAAGSSSGPGSRVFGDRPGKLYFGQERMYVLVTA